MSDLALHPHAKLNLGLRILGRRSDGYHEIVTRFQTIDLCDELHLSLAPPPLELSVEGAPKIADSSNLVVRAADALRAEFGTRAGARMLLRKRIPLAAGLGGGSSDAAVALLGLSRLWGLRADRRCLMRLGAALGADVPFFLEGGTALGRGRGNQIQPLSDLEPSWVCLLHPPFPISTREAYQEWAAARGAFRPVEKPAPDPLAALETGINDFQPAICVRHPELRQFLDRLLGGGARMAALSGSGPTLFGLFDEETAARRMATGWDWGKTRVSICKTVGRREYQERVGAVPLP